MHGDEQKWDNIYSEKELDIIAGTTFVKRLSSFLAYVLAKQQIIMLFEHGCIEQFFCLVLKLHMAVNSSNMVSCSYMDLK